MQCMCKCGCKDTSGPGESSYCRRCGQGDCPHPDEQVSETCPSCGRTSNLATIDEFGWCLSTSCTNRRNDDAWKVAVVRGY